MNELEKILANLSADKRKAKELSKGNIKAAYRATLNLPQAVVKVTSYSSGKKTASAHVNYISRNGELELEDPQGNLLINTVETQDRVNDWSDDFDKNRNYGNRKKSNGEIITRKTRDTLNIVLSAPKGSDPEKVRKSVREFAQKEFGETNDYLFAIHTDTDYPHGHLSVKMRGYMGEKLDPRKNDLQRYRSTFAERLRDNGIQVDATSRVFRGERKKIYKQISKHIFKKKVLEKKEITDDIYLNRTKYNWSNDTVKKHLKYKKGMMIIANILQDRADKTNDKNMELVAKKIIRFAQVDTVKVQKNNLDIER